MKLRVLPHVFYSVDGYVPRFSTYFSVESSHQCFHFGRGIVSRVLGVVSPSFQRNVFLLALSSQFRRFLHFVLNERQAWNWRSREREFRSAARGWLELCSSTSKSAIRPHFRRWSCMICERSWKTAERSGKKATGKKRSCFCGSKRCVGCR